MQWFIRYLCCLEKFFGSILKAPKWLFSLKRCSFFNTWKYSRTDFSGQVTPVLQRNIQLQFKVSYWYWLSCSHTEGHISLDLWSSSKMTETLWGTVKTLQVIRPALLCSERPFLHPPLQTRAQHATSKEKGRTAFHCSHTNLDVLLFSLFVNSERVGTPILFAVPREPSMMITITHGLVMNSQKLKSHEEELSIYIIQITSGLEDENSDQFLRNMSFVKVSYFK